MDRALFGLARTGLGVAALGAIPACLYSVDGGERAVMFDKLRGILPDPVGEGTHFKIPWLQEAYILDVRSRPREIKTLTGTKDLQMVNIWLRVLSHPKEEKLPEIYQTLGTDFDNRVLPSIGNEVLKAVVAKYKAEELLTQRSKVSKQIREELENRANSFHLVLDDVAITHLVFGKEFASAIEAKQVAYQEAERQQWIVQKAEQEKRAAIIRAEGEAEAAEIINQSIIESGPGYVEVQRIDTAKAVAESLARSRNVTYLPSSKGNGVLLGLNTGNA